MYTYSKKPSSREKKFTIHPLDDPGKQKYYSKNSHCYHYLKSTDPFVFKSILGTDYKTLINQQDLEIKTARDPNCPILSKPTYSNTKTPRTERSMNFSKYIEEKKCNDKKKTIDNNRYPNIPRRFLNKYNGRNLNDLNNRYICKSQSNFRPYHRKKDFKATYGYENFDKFNSNAEELTNTINLLKKNCLSSGLSEKKPKRKYDGFSFHDIPNIKKTEGNSELFDYFNERMQQTLNCSKGKNTKKSMNEKELRNNLFNQTSVTFRNKYHLPDVMEIANIKEVISKQKIGFSKEMGEKYNPYSFIAPPKNRVARNYLGDLFKH